MGKAGSEGLAGRTGEAVAGICAGCVPAMQKSYATALLVKQEIHRVCSLWGKPR